MVYETINSTECEGIANGEEHKHVLYPTCLCLNLKDPVVMQELKRLMTFVTGMEAHKGNYWSYIDTEIWKNWSESYFSFPSMVTFTTELKEHYPNPTGILEMLTIEQKKGKNVQTEYPNISNVISKAKAKNMNLMESWPIFGVDNNPEKPDTTTIPDTTTTNTTTNTTNTTTNTTTPDNTKSSYLPVILIVAICGISYYILKSRRENEE